MSLNRKYQILFAILALTGVAIISFCGSNIYHQTQAAGILSMEECLFCHDGLTGQVISVCLGKECLLKKNHSIMNKYPPPDKGERYASTSEIEKAGSILENGKTTCLSCHDLTRPPPRLIRDGDELCIICHLDKKSAD